MALPPADVLPSLPVEGAPSPARASLEIPGEPSGSAASPLPPPPVPPLPPSWTPAPRCSGVASEDEEQAPTSVETARSTAEAPYDRLLIPLRSMFVLPPGRLD